MMYLTFALEKRRYVQDIQYYGTLCRILLSLRGRLQVCATNTPMVLDEPLVTRFVGA